MQMQYGSRSTKFMPKPQKVKPPKDHFSKQSKTYKKFRPTYPIQLYDEILNHVSELGTCWDCATGNGQVAVELAKHFENVYATDLSKGQLRHSESRPNIHYKAERAEATLFDDNSFDLITVAQAIHWFDHIAFNTEANRVLKPNGIIAIWGYGLLRIDPKIDLLIDTFYQNTIGPYWDEERRHIDHAYSTIPFDFEEIKTYTQFNIKAKWTLKQLEGYLNSWSSVQNYLQVHDGENPVIGLIEHVSTLWDQHTPKEVNFPIFLYLGKHKN